MINQLLIQNKKDWKFMDEIYGCYRQLSARNLKTMSDVDGTTIFEV